MRARLWLAAAGAVLVLFVVAAATSWSLPQTFRDLGGQSPHRTIIDDGPTPSTAPRTIPPGSTDAQSSSPVTESTSPVTESTPTTESEPPTEPTQAPWRPAPVFDGRMLVAYYGTAGTGSLGVLGSGSIPDVTARLRAAAHGFAVASGRPVQIVYELIATVADGTPGPDHSYSHDIARADVERYLAAARRNHALLVLDLQPGRSDFLTVAKRYAWALKQPDVGLALDPEWRMGPGDVPGHVFGSVSAQEINATSAYVAQIAHENRLPQKLFMIHQFVPSMVRDIQDIKQRKGLALVQHIDGWGARVDKLATYHRVARPGQFTIGFKLFYREDPDLFTPAELLRAVPRVRFVSYQ